MQKTFLQLYNEISSILKNADIQDFSHEAKLLFEKATNINYLLAEKNSLVTKDMYETAIQYATKRATHYPIQYILGEWGFMNINLFVGEGVLVPRPDTEFVCEKALELLSNIDSPTVIDLCAGSGAIALGIKHEIQNAQITAVELSTKAFYYLEKNNKDYNIKLENQDVFTYQQNLQPETVDMIISNPPYISKDQMTTLDKTVLNEPEMALTDSDDGLTFYKHIAQHYKNALKKGGYLVFEIGYDQKQQVENILLKQNYRNIETYKDYGGNYRAVIAKKS